MEARGGTPLGRPPGRGGPGRQELSVEDGGRQAGKGSWAQRRPQVGGMETGLSGDCVCVGRERRWCLGEFPQIKQEKRARLW